MASWTDNEAVDRLRVHHAAQRRAITLWARSDQAIRAAVETRRRRVTELDAKVADANRDARLILAGLAKLLGSPTLVREITGVDEEQVSAAVKKTPAAQLAEFLRELQTGQRTRSSEGDSANEATSANSHVAAQAEQPEARRIPDGRGGPGRTEPTRTTG